MKEQISPKTVSGNVGGKALPTLPLEQLEADPHGVFRRYRKDHAAALHETGGYFVLRFADVERLSRDPRVHPSGTGFLEMLGVPKIFSLNLDDLAEIEKAAQELRDYVDKVLDERRRSPRKDFLSAFLKAATEAGEMSPEEVLFQILILIVAGTDTTRAAIAIQVGLLLQQREQWAEVCRDPALVPGAVAEAMRFEPIAAAVIRIADEDIDLDDSYSGRSACQFIADVGNARRGDLPVS